MTTVFHIDDDRLWTDFTVSILRECPEIQHIGSAKTGHDGITLCRERRPTVIILDQELPDMSGLEVMNRLCAQSLRPYILLLTGCMPEALLYRVIADGVSGLIWKGGDFEPHLLPALRAVGEGQSYFPPHEGEIIRRFRSSPDAFYKILTEREQVLLTLLAQGLKDEAIAIQTRCAQGTIRNHWRNIARKLGLIDRHDLMLWAATRGFGNAIELANLRDVGLLGIQLAGRCGPKSGAVKI